MIQPLGTVSKTARYAGEWEEGKTYESGDIITHVPKPGPITRALDWIHVKLLRREEKQRPGQPFLVTKNVEAVEPPGPSSAENEMWKKIGGDMSDYTMSMRVTMADGRIFDSLEEARRNAGPEGQSAIVEIIYTPNK